MKISPGNRDQRTSMHKDSNLHANFEQKSRNFLSLAGFLIESASFIIGNTDVELFLPRQVSGFTKVSG